MTINGYTYRSTVAVYGGEYMLPVSAEVRAGAGVAAGDELDVDLELDTAPRVVEVPADLAAALDAEPAALGAFDALSYSNQRRHVLALEGAKSPPPANAAWPRPWRSYLTGMPSAAASAGASSMSCRSSTVAPRSASAPSATSSSRAPRKSTFLHRTWRTARGAGPSRGT